MSINRKRLGALLCVVAVGIAVASTAGAAQQVEPGVTATTVTIGGTFPTGGIPTPASLYRTIPLAEQAYYDWVNTHGKVHGRDIIDTVVDDGYNPANTVPAVKDLVENQNVFAIVGSLGTAPGLATWTYLNNHKVPQVLLATGDSYWGDCAARAGFIAKPYCQAARPWTLGWQPDYPGEARLYAKYILAHNASPKVGILYQNDAYGLNYRAAFRKVFAANSALSDIVKEESYNVSDSSAVIGAHVAAIKGAGADTFAIFATPSASITALAASHALAFSPQVFLNNVSANRVFLLTAEGAATCNSPCADGVISSTYIKSNTVTPGDAGMQLAHDVIFATGNAFLQARFNAGDSNLIYGLASAWTFVDALKRAGINPTRVSLMNAMHTLTETPGFNTNPFVYPGMKVLTNSTHTFPMMQLQLQKWNSSVHDWGTLGGVVFSGK